MYLFLINPEAGGKKFSKIEKRFEALLKRLDIKHKLVIIENLADVPKLLEENVNTRTSGVAIVGGNATVNAVINAVVSENTPIAIVPLSKTNHLATSLGIHRWDQALRAIANPKLRDVRLGKVGTHYFIGNAEIASHQNIIEKYLKKTNPLVKFLGIRQSVPNTQTAVQMKVVVDQQLSITGNVHGIRIDLVSEKDKKLKVEILAHDDNKLSKTVLMADEIEAESEKKMPVVIGNETITHTPVEIRGVSKHIKLISPAGNGEKKEKKK